MALVKVEQGVVKIEDYTSVGYGTVTVNIVIDSACFEIITRI